jgi:hypothetical protein
MADGWRREFLDDLFLAVEQLVATKKERWV